MPKNNSYYTTPVNLQYRTTVTTGTTITVDGGVKLATPISYTTPPASTYSALGATRFDTSQTYYQSSSLAGPGALAGPQPPNSNLQIAANRVYLMQAIPKSSIGVTQMAATTAGTAASSNDTCEMGIYDASGNRLATTGALTGKLNAGTFTPIVAPLTTSLLLNAGQIYYLAFVGAVAGTAASLVSTSVGANAVYSILDTTTPTPIVSNFQLGAGSRLAQYYDHTSATLPTSINWNSARLTSNVIYTVARTQA